MCHCATQLFFTYFLMNHSFYYIRTSHKHVTFFFHHTDDIGQGRRVAGTSGAVSYTHLDVYKRQIVDSFLEHARIWYFGNDGTPKVFMHVPHIYFVHGAER